MVRVSLRVLLAATLVAADNAAAQPNPSDDIPQHVLDECDEQAMSYEGYDQAILAAAEELAALGVFEKNEFRNVRIGFCDLRGVQGPVATTSCARDTILLDQKYAGR